MKIVALTLLAGLAVTPALAQPAADQDTVSAAATTDFEDGRRAGLRERECG